MPHAKQPSMKPRRSIKALPTVKAAGLSLSPAPAIDAPTTNMLTPKIELAHKITLCEEEISDVSLATFYLFDSEKTQTLKFRTPGGGCGCAQGCGG
jgi:hypothetical protein